MGNIIKYLGFLFLLNNVLFSVSAFSIPGIIFFANIFFYFLVVLVFFLTSSSIKILKDIVYNKAFMMFFILNFINMIYYIMIEFGDIESLKYLFARFIQFSIFSITIFYLDFQFPDRLIKFLKYLTISILFISIGLNFPDLNNRYVGVFLNANEFAIIMVVGFSIILLTEKFSLINLLLLISFSSLVILSGSRSAIIGIFTAIIFYLIYNKERNWNMFFFLICSIIGLSIYTGDNNALIRVFNSELGVNRKYEYLYAIDTFLQKPFFGYGLKNYAFIDFSLLQYGDTEIDFGAHNGYLSILVQYGIFFSLFFFATLFYYLTIIFKSGLAFFGNNLNNTKFLFFILVYTLINGLFENTLIGINFLQSNLFWIIMGYLLFYNFKKNESNSISY